MLGLPIKTLTNIKNRLQRQQREVAENLKKIEKDDPTKDTAIAESSEPGTESWLAESHAKATAVGIQLKEMAGSIKIALAKIRRGTYGICERCKKDIEHSRLLVIPTTRYCLTCSKLKKR